MAARAAEIEMMEHAGFWLWPLAGLTAGLGHAAALWRTAHRPRADSVAAARMPLIFALLAGATMSGRLLPALGGWAGGLAATAAWLVARSGR
jgi:hypothetical protein